MPRSSLALAVILALSASAPAAFTIIGRHSDDPAEQPAAGAAAVIPMHLAVRRAAERFPGRVLDIAAVPPLPSERGSGIGAVYRLRMITSHRDVLDIRMDAADGRFLDVRGADLNAARHGRGRRRQDLR